MKKKQRISSSTTKITTTTTTTKEFRDHHPTTAKSELEEQASPLDGIMEKEQLPESVIGPRKVSIPGHEQYSDDR